jgi:uncharacterized membrane protein
VAEAERGAKRSRRETARAALRVLLAVLLVAQGVNHFVNEAFFAAMIPDGWPAPRALVEVSGVAEVAIGAAMLLPRLLAPAGWAALALFVAVFPANVNMALHPERFPTMAPAALWIRLPFQAVFCLWAWWCCLRDPRVRERSA